MRWAALVLFVFAVSLVLWYWRARRIRAAPRNTPKLRYPVILAHGLFGFDEIAIAGRKARYFRNIAALLETKETKFIATRVAPLSSIKTRAEQLVALLEKMPGEKFNVIAHSMGGLDARYAIAALGLGPRVASLVTIGTPHHGTPLAALPFFKVEAAGDLTPRALVKFNEAVPDDPGVAYLSVIASAPWWRTNPLLWLSHFYLWLKAGANDGIVPASSQKWGRVLHEVRADHWSQVGWSFTFDAAALYEEILRDLAALGF